MQILKADNLACPLDGAPFGPYGKTLRCANGHSFDEARQGYVHLLPVQHKKSREPGDSVAMVEARSRFLDAGFYRPLAERLNALALQHLPPSEHLCVVDAGCGEGYYLVNFLAALRHLRETASASASLIGLDIAKPAIVAAARRNKQITWLVASNRNPALLPASVDMIICMFGFPDFAAFRHILKPHGVVLLVDAGSEHLLELREVIYPEVRKSPPPSLAKAAQHGFALQQTSELRYLSDTLNRQQIADLLQMTPHLYRATHEGKQAAAQLEHIRLTVDVVFRLLKAT
ncbi:MAG TPA: methyltransferase domain-containing protein [Gammaproteobacteria bacterium]